MFTTLKYYFPELDWNEDDFRQWEEEKDNKLGKWSHYQHKAKQKKCNKNVKM